MARKKAAKQARQARATKSSLPKTQPRKTTARRGAKKKTATRRLSIQRLRDNHESKLADLRQRTADHLNDTMVRARAVVKDPAASPEDKAAASSLYNDMQLELQQFKIRRGVSPGG